MKDQRGKKKSKNKNKTREFGDRRSWWSELGEQLE
jgi:hypothetical protein